MVPGGPAESPFAANREPIGATAVHGGARGESGEFAGRAPLLPARTRQL